MDNKKVYAILSICLLLMINIVVADNVFPVYVRNRPANTNIELQLNYTRDILCLNVLLSDTQTIAIDNKGVGFMASDISSLGTTPDYICEYQDDILVKVHKWNDVTLVGTSLIFENVSINNTENGKIAISGNLEVDNNIYGGHTTGDMLRLISNSDDNAGCTILSTGQISCGVCSAGAPCFTGFNGQPGMYFDTSGNIHFATDGSTRMNIGLTGDVTIRENLNIRDDNKIILGTSQDAEIFYDSTTNSLNISDGIAAGKPDLNIINFNSINIDPGNLNLDNVTTDNLSTNDLQVIDSFRVFTNDASFKSYINFDVVDGSPAGDTFIETDSHNDGYTFYVLDGDSGLYNIKLIDGTNWDIYSNGNASFNNVSANYFKGDGSLLTGVSTDTSEFLTNHTDANLTSIISDLGTGVSHSFSTHPSLSLSGAPRLLRYSSTAAGAVYMTRRGGGTRESPDFVSNGNTMFTFNVQTWANGTPTTREGFSTNAFQFGAFANEDHNETNQGIEFRARVRAKGTSSGLVTPLAADGDGVQVTQVFQGWVSNCHDS